MKQTGIWLDKNKALIVTIDNQNETFETVQSNIEHYSIHGGSGTKIKGGPQDVVQDSRYLEREKHQFQSYFQNILEKVNDSSELVIFGPAQTNKYFAKIINKDYKALAKKIKAVKKTDSMTDNQIMAWVRNFFSKK